MFPVKWIWPGIKKTLFVRFKLNMFMCYKGTGKRQTLKT